MPRINPSCKLGVCVAGEDCSNFAQQYRSETVVRVQWNIMDGRDYFGWSSIADAVEIIASQLYDSFADFLIRLKLYAVSKSVRKFLCMDVRMHGCLFLVHASYFMSYSLVTNKQTDCFIFTLWMRKLKNKLF